MISRASMQGSQYELTAKTSSTENFWYNDCLQSLLTKLMLGKTAIVDPTSPVKSSARRSCELMKSSASVLIPLGVWQSTVFLWFLQSILRASITVCWVLTLILILSDFPSTQTNKVAREGPAKTQGSLQLMINNKQAKTTRQNSERNPLRRGVTTS